MQLTNAGDPLAPGRQVGKYEVLRRLAAGGMAEIYLARATGIEGFRKEVVLKRMLPQFASRPEFVRQFLDEARLAATLDHPNVATIFDIDQVDGIYVLAMEYLQGEDLGVLLWALEEMKRPFPLEHALTIATGVAAGLHHAHEKHGPDGQLLGIVHRDVSPSNVVITYEGGVKLVDFGIAKATAQAGGTDSGALKGKLGYMSPEQGCGERLDRRSDLFSLASVIYEMTTQQRLFQAETEAQTLRKVMLGEVVPPSVHVPGYPPELEAILMKALRLDRNERYATARELQQAVEGFAKGRGITLSSAGLGAWLDETLRGATTAGPAVGFQGADAPSPSTRVMSSKEVADALDGRAIAESGGRDEPLLGPAPAGGAAGPASFVSRTGTAAVAGRFGGAEPTLDRDPAPAISYASPADATPVPAPPSAQTVQPKSMSRAGVAAAFALALVGSAVAIVLAVRPVAVPAGSGTSVLLVAERGQVALDGTAAAAAAPEKPRLEAKTEGQPIVAAAPSLPPAAAEPRRTRRASDRAAAPVRPESFSSTFARRERDLAACASGDPEAAASAAALSVRFRIDRDGKVLEAVLFPPELAESRLGACVAGVARSTRFAAQPQPVVFRIPVTVRRHGGPATPGDR